MQESRKGARLGKPSQRAVEAKASGGGTELSIRRRISPGTPHSGHPWVERSRRSWAGSSGRARGRSRRQARRSGCEDGGTHAHNTLSADSSDVQVFYPFHPLHGATLQILRRPKRGDGAVCVIDPAGRRLKIPVWMLSRDYADVKITDGPHLSKEALLSLAALIASHLNCKDHIHDNLLQTAVDRRKGGRRGATETSGPDDPKGTRSRATGRRGTRRSERSHGPRSGRGLSRRERKSR